MANTFSRILHDVGLAAWFGGTLANAVALNPAAGEASGKDATAVANAGWNRWTPVNAAAIGAHVVGSGLQLIGNRQRVVGQKGVAQMSIVKTVLTVGALGITAWARVLGRKVDQPDTPVKDGTTPTAGTKTEVAKAQKQLTALQWAVPAITGGLVVVSAVAGEQQRPAEVLSGLLDKASS